MPSPARSLTLALVAVSTSALQLQPQVLPSSSRNVARTAGVDMGRNVFQSEAPLAMIKAVAGVVHDGLKPAEGLELFNDLKNA